MSQPRLTSFLRRFRRARGGTMAIEFAFLALPFLFLLFSVLELALVFLLSASLDTAMEDASREIRTGGFQSSNPAPAPGATLDPRPAAFKATVCRKMLWLASGCDAALTVDVRSYRETDPAKWSAANALTNPYSVQQNSAGDDELKFTVEFAPGGPKDIVLVRGYFKWVLITPFLSQALKSPMTGVAVINSTQTFRNEPYA